MGPLDGVLVLGGVLLCVLVRPSWVWMLVYHSNTRRIQNRVRPMWTLHCVQLSYTPEVISKPKVHLKAVMSYRKALA
jgi:hypothetical protein